MRCVTFSRFRRQRGLTSDAKEEKIAVKNRILFWLIWTKQHIVKAIAIVYGSGLALVVAFLVTVMVSPYLWAEDTQLLYHSAWQPGMPFPTRFHDLLPHLFGPHACGPLCVVANARADVLDEWRTERQSTHDFWHFVDVYFGLIHKVLWVAVVYLHAMPVTIINNLLEFQFNSAARLAADPRASAALVMFEQFVCRQWTWVIPNFIEYTTIYALVTAKLLGTLYYCGAPLYYFGIHFMPAISVIYLCAMVAQLVL